MSVFTQPIAEQIWNMKYRLQTPNPDIPNDRTVQDTWSRIAKDCSGWDEKTNGTQGPKYNEYLRFYDALSDFRFLPAGRIIAGAGSGRNVTLFNCYVMGTIPDSMSGIFDMLKEAALTMQQGGGIGYDFSPLRPSGSPVKGVDADASGPLTFMDCWDSMCRTVMSAGSRRGAMMATMRCDHPDIEEFITAKKDAARFRMFNMSVLATDLFMEAVENDWDWALVHKTPPITDDPDEHIPQMEPDGNLVFDRDKLPYIHKTIKARDLWDLIMQSTYDQAEPGVLFIDRINRYNNLHYVEDITATNPCGEQPLPPYGACLLGSLNLTKMVNQPFTDNANINWKLIKDTAKTATRMLDAVIDISNFPLEEQAIEARSKRRMGIGVTGLADLLMMLDITYGSAKAQDIAEIIMKTITIACYEESIQMACEKGACEPTRHPDDRAKYLESEFMMGMPTHIRQGVKENGIRNALLTSIAPTGTISLYAGNVSSGLEPVFAPSYDRKVIKDDGTKITETVTDYAVDLYHKFGNPNELPNSFVSAQTLTPEDHLSMQAAMQRWVDSSISKTINLPKDISFDDFKAVYWSAWEQGCKGCTTYRPNDVTGSILSVTEEESEPETDDEEAEKLDEAWLENEFSTTTPKTGVTPRQKALSGQTYKLKWEDSNVYVTINNFEENGVTIPFEIFINTQDMSHFQWATALTRMMSSVFRRGGDISFVIQDLKSIMDPNGGAWVEGRYLPSFIALLGQTLEEHIRAITVVDETVQEQKTETTVKPLQCPSCKGFNVNLSGGCPVCGDCGYSKCG